MVCRPFRPWPWLTVWCTRFYQAEPAPVVGTTKCPESLCLDFGVTSVRETCTVSSEDITPRSSLLQTHSPFPSSSPLLWFLASFEESLQVAASLCCSWDLPDAIPQFFPQMPGPQSRRSHRVQLPVSSSMSSAFPRLFLGRLPACPTNAISPW